MDSTQQLPEDDDFVPQRVELDDILSDAPPPEAGPEAEASDADIAESEATDVALEVDVDAADAVTPPAERALRLPAHGSTVTAEDLRVRLVLAADLDGEMCVDAGEVESVGQAVLQLLVAARAEAVATGKTFSIENPSPAFVDRVTRCRLADAIGLQTGDTQ